MPVVSYVDTRDVLNRLARVHVTGATAQGWLPTLDPLAVRAISDEDLAALVGGTLNPADLPDGTWGAGPYGFDVYGGPTPQRPLYPSPLVFPSPTLYPRA